MTAGRSGYWAPRAGGSSGVGPIEHHVNSSLAGRAVPPTSPEPLRLAGSGLSHAGSGPDVELFGMVTPGK